MNKLIYATFLISAVGCGDSKLRAIDAAQQIDAPKPDAPGPAVYAQVEHLARPGINEVLLTNFAFAGGYNATAPSFAGADTATLNMIVGEAKTTLKALYLGVCLTDGLAGITDPTMGLEPAGMPCADLGTAVLQGDGVTLSVTSAAAASTYADLVFSQFEPDVMRIDTSRPSGYLTLCGTASDTPLLCGGRKLNDDVIDITYDYLLAGAAITNSSPAQFIALVSDGVVYNNSAANLTNNPTSLSLPDPTNHNQGHPATTTTFPYSAPPI